MHTSTYFVFFLSSEYAGQVAQSQLCSFSARTCNRSELRHRDQAGSGSRLTQCPKAPVVQVFHLIEALPRSSGKQSRTLFGISDPPKAGTLDCRIVSSILDRFCRTEGLGLTSKTVACDTRKLVSAEPDPLQNSLPWTESRGSEQRPSQVISSNASD